MKSKRLFFISALFLLGTAFVFLACVSSSKATPAKTLLREYEITYKMTIPVANRPFGKLRAWVPLAASNTQQQIIRRDIKTSMDVPLEFTQDVVYKNEMAYLELTGPLKKDFELSVTYHAKSHDAEKLPVDNHLSAEEKSQYLQPSKLVIIDDRIRQMARGITEGFSTDLEKAQAIFNHVIEIVKYDKTIPGYGKGDTARVCLIAAGNCTDFHSLFISLARASNIPARFHIGLTVPQGKGSPIAGYHCWAEFYTQETGWRVVDASEAWKHPEMKEFYFGHYDANKFRLTTGRDVPLTPEQEGEPINIFFYPHVEIDGITDKYVRTEFYSQNVT